MKEVWIVRHRFGWCATKNGRPVPDSCDHVPTKCDHVINLPGGSKRGVPDCPGCYFNVYGEEKVEPERQAPIRSLLYWGKPPKEMSTEDWKNISADGAPPGTYTPNMPDEYLYLWKAKLVGIKSGSPRVEIRKSTHANDGKINLCAQILIIVSPNGGFKGCPEGVNVKISMNGPASFTFDSWPELAQAVAEAKQKLEEHGRE